MIAAAVALVELWRRGYLDSAISSFTQTTAAGGNVAKRPFTLPTASRSAYVGGGTDTVQP